MSGATRHDGATPETLPRAERCSSCGTTLRASARGGAGLCRVCAAMPPDARQRHAERAADEQRRAREQVERETRHAAEVAALRAAAESERTAAAGEGRQPNWAAAVAEVREPASPAHSPAPARVREALNRVLVAGTEADVVAAQRMDWGEVADRVAAAVRSGASLGVAAREVGSSESALNNALSLGRRETGTPRARLAELVDAARAARAERNGAEVAPASPVPAASQAGPRAPDQPTTPQPRPRGRMDTNAEPAATQADPLPVDRVRDDLGASLRSAHAAVLCQIVLSDDGDFLRPKDVARLLRWIETGEDAA